MQRRWLVSECGDALAANNLCRELGIPSFLASLLLARGLRDPEAAGAYLKPRMMSLQAPELLPAMNVAVERILAAMAGKERIVLYGDYDVDGVSSLAILSRFLGAMGTPVACFLPQRIGEGYGLSAAGIARCCAEHNPQLLIAVDCGTTSVREIRGLRERGVDVIVLDHHEPADELPDCLALVNPKLGEDFHYLCSAGVAFKVAHAILKKQRVDGVDLKDYLDLVALATIADIVPLVGENRIFVWHGLKRMAHTKWVGLAALMRVADVQEPIRGTDIGFRLGPRINAAGRLGSAQRALDLLTTDDASEARNLAATLDTENRERQNVERGVVRDVEQWVEENFSAERDTSIIAGRREWHVGVLGIVASKLMRRHHRPTLLVGFDDSGIGKGSGRSIEGLSLTAMLKECSQHLEKFGGHEMAAGLTVTEEAFPAFRAAFESSARSRATRDIFTPCLKMDTEIALHELGSNLLSSQDMIEPFGMANEQPVFFTRALKPIGTPRVMKEKHLKMEFAINRQRLAAVFFNAQLSDLPPPPWDVAYTLDWNSWQGNVDAQMRIVEIRHAQ